MTIIAAMQGSASANPVRHHAEDPTLQLMQNIAAVGNAFKNVKFHEDRLLVRSRQ